mmetsp:Transcript_3885/g.10398  ORF Transcript_3885/g.10398 Transcript_3885/m.10398 type:complete len:659 (+) Transcript_3885:1744-3720(+)
MLRVRIVRRLQVDPVLRLGDLQSLIPLAARLIQQVQQVEAAALLVQRLCLLNHVQVHRDDRQLGLGLRVHARAEGAGRAGVAHLPKALLGHVQPARLDAHLGHTLPNAVGLHVLDALVRLVGVVAGKVVGEVQQCGGRLRIHTLQAGEVAQHGPAHCGRLRGVRLLGEVHVRHGQPHRHLADTPALGVVAADRVLQQNVVRVGREQRHHRMDGLVLGLLQAQQARGGAGHGWRLRGLPLAPVGQRLRHDLRAHQARVGAVPGVRHGNATLPDAVGEKVVGVRIVDEYSRVGHAHRAVAAVHAVRNPLVHHHRDAGALVTRGVVQLHGAHVAEGRAGGTGELPRCPLLPVLLLVPLRVPHPDDVVGGCHHEVVAVGVYALRHALRVLGEADGVPHGPREVADLDPRAAGEGDLLALARQHRCRERHHLPLHLPGAHVLRAAVAHTRRDLEDGHLLAAPHHQIHALEAQAPDIERGRDGLAILARYVVQHDLCWRRLHGHPGRLHHAVELRLAQDHAGALGPEVEHVLARAPGEPVDGTLDVGFHYGEHLPVRLRSGDARQRAAAPLHDSPTAGACREHPLARVEVERRDLVAGEAVPLVYALQRQDVALVVCEVPEAHYALVAGGGEQARAGPGALQLLWVRPARELQLRLVDDLARGV